MAMTYYLSEDIIRIFSSILIGAIVGLEREYRSKSAGLRTMVLVSLGSCLFTLLSQRIGNGVSADRIAANIVTGIGFLGAGVIFKDNNKIGGITTATTIWMVSALGMAIGSGHYQAAIVGTFAVIIVLVLFISFQGWIDRINRSRTYHIVCINKLDALNKYDKLFKQFNLKSYNIKKSKKADRIIGIWEVHGPDKKHDKIIQIIINDADVLEFDF